ncbi:hypothetical protein ACETRX_34045 [Labrys portucalensis]|uniref:Lipoprotein n=1 Tax=Labrys neptuniae TaxID=376174 RepID=A0ABV6ZRD4_9HYPH
MRSFVFRKIALTTWVGLGLVSCTGSIQQAGLGIDSQSSGNSAPRTISGKTLDKCTDHFKKWNNVTYPQGKTATYDPGGVIVATRYYPGDPETSSKISSLVSYKIALGKNWYDPDNSYAFCFYKYSSGNLSYLENIVTNGYGDAQSIYVYNISSNIYYMLTGKMIRIN